MTNDGFEKASLPDPADGGPVLLSKAFNANLCATEPPQRKTWKNMTSSEFLHVPRHRYYIILPTWVVFQMVNMSLYRYILPTLLTFISDMSRSIDHMPPQIDLVVARPSGWRRQRRSEPWRLRFFFFCGQSCFFLIQKTLINDSSDSWMTINSKKNSIQFIDMDSE